VEEGQVQIKEETSEEGRNKRLRRRWGEKRI
jgi:hypothetical protein